MILHMKLPENLSYDIVTSADIAPDYTASRRYHPILKKLGRSLLSDRHQVIISDSVPQAATLVTQYFLHVDSLMGGQMDAIDRAIIMFSLSSEEVANSPSLYVNLHGKEPENQPPKSQEEDAINPARFDPRMFTEVVRFRYGDKDYETWVNRFWEHHSQLAQWVDPDNRNVWPFTHFGIAPLLLEYFEADHNRILFINEICEPQTETEKEQLIKSLILGLYMEKRYGANHADYVQKIPNVVWILPYSLYPFSWAFDYFGYNIIAGDHPDENFLLYQPFDQWINTLPDGTESIDAQRRAKQYMLTASEGIRKRLKLELDHIARGLMGTQKRLNLSDEEALSFLGINQREFEFLKQLS